MITGNVLFMLLGFGLGYAIKGRAAFLALIVPVLFALMSARTQGIDGRLLLMLVISLALTALAVLAGRALDRTLERREAARA